MSDPMGSLGDVQPLIVREATAIVRAAERHLQIPDDGECLACWLARAVAMFGCDGSARWARVWAHPAQSRSRRRLKGSCDCQLVANVYRECTFTEHRCEEVLM